MLSPNSIGDNCQVLVFMTWSFVVTAFQGLANAPQWNDDKDDYWTLAWPTRIVCKTRGDDDSTSEEN